MSEDRYIFVQARLLDLIPDSYMPKVVHLYFKGRNVFSIQQGRFFFPGFTYLKDIGDEDLTYLSLIGIKFDKKRNIILPALTKALECTDTEILLTDDECFEILGVRI